NNPGIPGRPNPGPPNPVPGGKPWWTIQVGGVWRLDTPEKMQNAAKPVALGAHDPRSHSVRAGNPAVEYSLAYYDLNDLSLSSQTFDQRVQQERDRIVASMPGSRVTSETNITVNGHSGKEFQVTRGAEVAIRRIVLVRGRPWNRIYILGV